MINTIVIDIDGTLIDKNEQIQPKTKKALIDLQEKGIKVILASGRPLNAMMGLVEELNLKKYHGIVVCYNGAQAYDVQGERVIFNSEIDKKYIDEIIDFNLENDIPIMIQEEEYMIVHNVYDGIIYKNNPEKIFNVMEWEARNGNFLLKEVKDMKSYVDFPVNKVLSILEPERLKKEYEKLSLRFKGKVHAVQSSAHFFEYLALGVNKGTAIEKLNLSSENIIAFGDGMNDKEMLEYAKIGVCMGNGSETVKSIADYVTTSNNDEGIYNALVYFGLINKEPN